MNIHSKITRCYKAIMSTGEPIQIEQDEIEAVLEAASTGSFIKVRQGVINPSFVVSIVSDEKRRLDFMEETKYEPEKRELGMKPLKDIFLSNGIKAIQNTSTAKQIHEQL